MSADLLVDQRSESEPADAGGDPVRRADGRRLGLCLVWIGIVAFLIVGGFEAWHDSPTFDEPVYVSSGLIAILHHDLADNAEHPPLFKVLAALPVLAVHPVIPANGRWNTNDERSYSARFARAQTAGGTLRSTTMASRLVPLVESAVLALALFALAELLFGVWAGVLAALVWLLDPLIVGLSHLDGVDLPFALCTVLVSLTLVRWLRRRDRTSLVVLGLAVGAAVSAQATGLLIGALAVVVVIISCYRAGASGRAPWISGGIVAVVGWALTWGIYIALDPSVVLHSGPLLPAPYIAGLHFLATNDTGASTGFILGVSWSGANPWFWPASLLIKLSTPVLLIFIAGPLALVRLVRGGAISRSVWRQTLVAVVLPSAILFAFELPNPRTLGVRYLLPSIALWTVVASPLALAVRRFGVVALAVVVGAAGIVMAVSYPVSLAWTSPPFTPGYRVGTDSNVDWGQDFAALQTWSRGRHPYVAYFGPRGISVADLAGAHRLIGTDPGHITGWVAASATELTSGCPPRAVVAACLLSGAHFGRDDSHLPLRPAAVGRCGTDDAGRVVLGFAESPAGSDPPREHGRPHVRARGRGLPRCG